MAKDPAINWYFDNWVGGTKGFSRHQKGCYMDLLEAQFYLGPLSLEQIKNTLGPDFSQWESALKKKFFHDENNSVFFNERLEAEKDKRQRYSESRSKNRAKKDMKDISNTHDEHISNTPGIGIGTDIDIESKGGLRGKFKKPTVDEIKAYCLERKNLIDAQTFHDFYQSKNWMIGKNKMKDWQACIRTWEKSSKSNNNQTIMSGDYGG